MSVEQSQTTVGEYPEHGWATGQAERALDREKSLRGQLLSAVLLDADHVSLEWVKQVLARLGIGVVGKTTVPGRALILVAECKPNLLVAVVEKGNSELDGIACLRRGQEYVPYLTTVVITMSDDREHIAAAVDTAAWAYVLKRVHIDHFAVALRQLLGHSILFAEDGLGPLSNGHAQSPLSRREVEILQLVAQGRSNADTARTLWLTEETVKFHLSNIYRKLGVSNRTAAGRWAHTHGLLSKSRVSPQTVDQPPKRLDTGGRRSGRSMSVAKVGPRPLPSREAKPLLSRREVEILRLVAEGRSNAATARALWLTEETVKFHLSNIYRKLGVSNRTAAGGWAHAHGLLPKSAE